MTTITGAEREAQRVAHLVLGQPRPKPVKVSKRTRRRQAAVLLAPDIEVRLVIRERWDHKTRATPETCEHAAHEAAREGSIARLLASGAIDAHQFAAAEEIRLAYEQVIADVAVRTAKWGGVRGGAVDGAAVERYADVRRALAYTAWREAIAGHAAMLLAIIIDDLALTSAARRWRMSNRRAKAVLVAALDRWRRA